MYAVKITDETDISYLSKVELSEQVGVSRNVIHQYIDDLVKIGIYETRRGNGLFVRYRPDTESPIVRTLQSANEKMIDQMSTE